MKLWPIAICVFACKGHDKPAPPPPTAPTPTVIVDARPPGPEKANVAKVLACLDAENAGKLDVASCYTPTAYVDTPLAHADSAAAIARYATLDRTAFPDAKQELRLVIAHDSNVVIVSLVTATQAAPIETWLGVIPSHGKPVGFLIARQIAVDKTGLIWSEHQFYDVDTLASQLGVATSAPLAPVIAPSGKPPELHLSTSASDDADLWSTLEAAVGKLDNTSNGNFAEWFGDHFTFTDSDLPAPLDAAQTSAIVAAMRGGLEARPHPVGFTVAGDSAAVYLDLSITNDGPVPELGLTEKPKDPQPTWYLPTLVVAKFASHRNGTGKLAAVWMFHRDRPPHDLGIVVGKVTFKDKVPDSNMLTADTAHGGVDLEWPYAHCRDTVAAGFVGKVNVAMAVDVNGKLMKPVAVTGASAKLASCLQGTLKDQLFPNSAVPIDATFTIAFTKPVVVGPIKPLEDTFAQRFARKPEAAQY
jgi:hypothetical protein